MQVMLRLFLTNVSHCDCALLATNPEIHGMKIWRKCCNKSPHIGTGNGTKMTNLGFLTKSAFFDDK